MRHIIWQQNASYPVVILAKSSIFQKHALHKNYVEPLGLPEEDVLAMTLEMDSSNKASAKFMKTYLNQLLPELDSLGTKVLYVTDSGYFKTLTKARKIEPNYGYALPCVIPGYEHMQVVIGMNYQQLIYDPSLIDRMELTFQPVRDIYQHGKSAGLGQNVIKYAEYPSTVSDIAKALNNLHQYPYLSCDLETFSLNHNKAGIGTVAFAWNHHEGIAFACDYQPLEIPQGKFYGKPVVNHAVRKLLREFFTHYQGTIRWHNANFDMKPAIASLWMKDGLDIESMLHGLEIMTRDFDDTKVITYLATNSTAGNILSLKHNAHEFAGNYAQDDDDIKDIRRIPLPDLLEYNLIDALCTNYVYDKHYPTMVNDNQEDLYLGLMKDSIKTLVQVELCGMPLDMDKVRYARQKLEAIRNSFLSVFENNSIIEQFEDGHTERARIKDYEDRKAKAKNPGKILPKQASVFPRQKFNPNSGPQLQILLYKQLGLPVVDYTKKKQPATGGDTLEKLKNHAQDSKIVEILDALIGFIGVEKILSSFIPAFEDATLKADGMHYLHGSFNLGGTVSGRLSSSNPNLQQTPSGSQYAKIIKDCFRAPEGWLMCGADFNSLEDYISALTTKDPNKIRVYTDGYDGHCLRAFWYFPDRLPGIVDTVDSINSIKKKFPEIRQLSKTPTFALTYQGTYITLMKNLGFDEPTAKKIEKAYHDLYAVSDKWVQDKMDQAAKDGYVDVAFGLRVRTPLLAQVIRGNNSTPYQAEAEARTAGNALGQSYGLLNNRAANAFMKRVWASEYRHDIKPIALIHDAIYFIIRQDTDVIQFVNDCLIEEMQWQELPEIQHDEVKLGAELDLFWPSWAYAITLPNKATKTEIADKCYEHVQKLQAA